MPRYIDADALIKKIFPLGMFDNGNYAVNARAVKKAIDRIPTADVAPKSEVAREIFAEIEKYLLAQEVETEQTRVKEVGDWILHNYLPRHFAELKKKYIGEQK